MRVIRKFAVQGHAVPHTAHRPLGPFPAEVLAKPTIAYGEEPDSLPEEMDGVKFYRCKDCGEVLRGDEIDHHYCEDN